MQPLSHSVHVKQLILFPVKGYHLFLAIECRLEFHARLAHCLNQVMLVPHRDTIDMNRLVPFVIPMYFLVSLSSIFVHDPSPIFSTKVYPEALLSMVHPNWLYQRLSMVGCI